MYIGTITNMLKTEAQVICTCTKENISGFRYFMYDLKMSTKSKTDSEFSRMPFSEILSDLTIG